MHNCKNIAELLGYLVPQITINSQHFDRFKSCPRENYQSIGRQFFLGEKKLITPECQNRKLKNALNFDKQKTVRSYLIPTWRNLDFRGRGDLKFELSN